MWFSGFYLDSVSHIWGVPTMKITDLSILCKWETLKNWQCIKYLFAPLYAQSYIHPNRGHDKNKECPINKKNI